MIEYFLFLFGCVCITIFLARADIFDYIKKPILKRMKQKSAAVYEYFHTLFYCPICIGFWVGLAGTFFIYNELIPGPFRELLFSVCLFPFMVSISSFFWCRIIFSQHLDESKKISGKPDYYDLDRLE